MIEQIITQQNTSVTEQCQNTEHKRYNNAELKNYVTNPWRRFFLLSVHSFSLHGFKTPYLLFGDQIWSKRVLNSPVALVLTSSGLLALLRRSAVVVMFSMMLHKGRNSSILILVSYYPSKCIPEMFFLVLYTFTDTTVQYSISQYSTIQVSTVQYKSVQYSTSHYHILRLVQ